MNWIEWVVCTWPWPPLLPAPAGFCSNVHPHLLFFFQWSIRDWTILCKTGLQHSSVWLCVLLTNLFEWMNGELHYAQPVPCPCKFRMREVFLSLYYILQFCSSHVKKNFLFQDRQSKRYNWFRGLFYVSNLKGRLIQRSAFWSPPTCRLYPFIYTLPCHRI